MKTLLTKRGFEFIFSVSLIAIFALPLLVFAQGRNDTEIRIANGDTVVNGKNIKELSTVERRQALRDISNLGNVLPPQNIEHQRIVIRKRGFTGTGTDRVIIEKRRFDDDMAQQFRFPHDSSARVFKFRMKHPGFNDSTFTFNYRMDDDPENRFDNPGPGFNFPRRGPRMEFMHRRNVQSFEFTNTGSDGISTRISFRVTDPSPEKLKEITGVEKHELEIKDLNLVPEFSSGKITLMFSLSSHAVAEAKLMDNTGKVIWSDKVLNGAFNKSFALGLNGVYFLEIKQAGKIALKRIIKEEPPAP